MQIKQIQLQFKSVGMLAAACKMWKDCWNLLFSQQNIFGPSFIQKEQHLVENLKVNIKKRHTSQAMSL